MGVKRSAEEPLSKKDLPDEALALTTGSEEETLDKWKSLDEGALDQEIDVHRKIIQSVGTGKEAQLISKEELQNLVGTLRDEDLLGRDVYTDEDGNPIIDAGLTDGCGDAGVAEGTNSWNLLVTKTDEDEEGVVEGNVDDLDPSEWQVPPQCIPVHANVTTMDWRPIYEAAQFDVIMMDPPWQLATANPTRGVSLGYSQLTDRDIENLPIEKLQTNGFLFIWVINAKYKYCFDLFKKWGYSMVDEIVWVKTTCNRRLAKSHGYYLQHAKEVCLVGKKGASPPNTKGNVCNDIILSERRGQSQKPVEIYELIEDLVPGGMSTYLVI
eukprot:gene10436-12342_t